MFTDFCRRYWNRLKRWTNPVSMVQSRFLNSIDYYDYDTVLIYNIFETVGRHLEKYGYKYLKLYINSEEDSAYYKAQKELAEIYRWFTEDWLNHEDICYDKWFPLEYDKDIELDDWFRMLNNPELRTPEYHEYHRRMDEWVHELRNWKQELERKMKRIIELREGMWD